MKPVVGPRKRPLAHSTSSPIADADQPAEDQGEEQPDALQHHDPDAHREPADEGRRDRAAPRGSGFSRTSAERGWRAHSGHLIPTGV